MLYIQFKFKCYFLFFVWASLIALYSCSAPSKDLDKFDINEKIDLLKLICTSSPDAFSTSNFNSLFTLISFNFFPPKNADYA